MDKEGNIALGYSASSSTLYPSIRYTTRLVNDAQDTFGEETTLMAGSASQSGISRWGDYSSLNIDPADDCTFWYTNEYIQNENEHWKTRIGSFKIDSCVADNLTPTATPTTNPSATNTPTSTPTSQPGATSTPTATATTSSGAAVEVGTHTVSPSSTVNVPVNANLGN